MNWKIIFQLSIFGLIMAFGTISLIPEGIEPFFWLAIFLFCAYVIAKVCPGKYFWHGFMVSIINCIWITAAHIAFYSSYIAHHPSMVKMSAQHPILPTHPRLAMLIMGPVVGVICGIILGIFAWIASMIVSKKAAAV